MKKKIIENSNTLDTKQKIDQLAELIKKQKKLSAEDGRWLIEIYTTQEARLELALGQADGVRKTIDDRDKKIFQLRETLLLWLAMRGAASVEMFKATQGIANRTVAILNE